MPKPRSGELLIKVAAAPINPSDYGVWRNSKPERCPLAIGNEGSGVVVASGGGSARIVAGVGSKVGFVNLPKGQGAYSEYVTVSAMTGTFPLPADLDVELAASFFVNPVCRTGPETPRPAGPAQHLGALLLTRASLALDSTRSSASWTPCSSSAPRDLYTRPPRRRWAGCLPSFVLPAAYCLLLPTAYCLLPSAHCLLPTSHCPLPTADCRLPTAYCPLPTTYCLACLNLAASGSPSVTLHSDIHGTSAAKRGGEAVRW